MASVFPKSTTTMFLSAFCTIPETISPTFSLNSLKITMNKETGEIHVYAEYTVVEEVEEVFIGYKVSDSDKTKKAAEFVKKNIVKNVNYKKLSSDKLIKNTSNMLLVFDKYLQRK